MSFAWMMLVGIGIDLAFGWPDRLYQRIGHPVTWIGKLITHCEARLNQGARVQRLVGGLATVVLVCIVTFLPAAAVMFALPDGILGIVLGGVLAWPFIAVRSMHDHVKAVAGPLSVGDLDRARYAVSMIVGRDPKQLDAPAVSRAALESLAENTSDGIVAPVFWGVVAGLPGIAVYKAINTMDSMIGHKNERYEAFGKVAARLDDLVNLIPARLTGVLFALVARGQGRARAFGVMRREARFHRSPNAGWPEGAMAGALNIRLSGPRAYGTHVVDEPWMNGSAPDPDTQGVSRGLRLYRHAMLLMGLALFTLGLF